MKIINKKTGKTISPYALALKIYKTGIPIIYSDIETVLRDPETGIGYILDECGSWAYVNEKYKLVKGKKGNE